jgi:hypothetical protein
MLCTGHIFVTGHIFFTNQRDERVACASMHAHVVNMRDMYVRSSMHAHVMYMRDMYVRVLKR